MGGFLEDVGNSLSSAIGSAWSVVTSPVRAVDQVLHGGNIGNVVKNTVSQNFGNIANAGSGGWLNYFGQTKSGQDFLKDKTVQQLSFGVSGNFQGYSQTLTDLGHGTELNNLTPQERDAYLRFGATTVGVAAAASYLPASLTPKLSLTNVGIGQAAYSNIQKGNLVGAGAVIGGAYLSNPDNGLPDIGIGGGGSGPDLQKYLDIFNQAYQNAQSRVPGSVWGGTSSTSGYDLPAEQGYSLIASSLIPVALVIAGAYFLTRKK